MKAAFNDPKSARTSSSTATRTPPGYVKDGGLADVTEEFADWSEAKDTDPTAKQSVTVDGKVCGNLVGVRALYYRTDILKDLGLEAPRTQGRVISTAKDARGRSRPLRTRGRRRLHVRRDALHLVPGRRSRQGKGSSYAATIDGAAAQKGIKAYTSLFGPDNCPAAKCAGMTGNDTVTAFSSGKAGMAIGGDFSHAAIEAGKMKGKYEVVPLPGVKPGWARRPSRAATTIGVLKSTSHRASPSA